jgi:hypothetical protein
LRYAALSGDEWKLSAGMLEEYTEMFREFDDGTGTAGGVLRTSTQPTLNLLLLLRILRASV